MRRLREVCYVLAAVAVACAQAGCLAPTGEGGGSRRGLFGLSDPLPARSSSEDSSYGQDDSSSGSSTGRAGSSSAARNGRARSGGGFAMGRESGSRTGIASSPRASERDLRTPPGFGTSPYSADAGSGLGGVPHYGDLVKVEGNTWRTSVPATRLFSLVGRSLSQNYLLSRVDRRNLTVHTDWDKFFIDGRLFRNRLLISVFPVSARQTEAVIRNNLEYFSGTPGKPEDMSESAWLPSPDITDEVTRLVDAVNLQIQNAAASRRQAR